MPARVQQVRLPSAAPFSHLRVILLLTDETQVIQSAACQRFESLCCTGRVVLNVES